MMDDSLHEAAKRFMQRGRVSGLRVLQNGAVVSGIATLDGESPERTRTFRVYVRLGNGRIEGECSCRGTQPCEHVAAVLVEGKKSAQPATRPDQPAQSPRPPNQASRTSRQHLCYLLQLRNGKRCELSVWIAQSGDARDALPFVPRRVDSGDLFPRYVDALDREILERLMQRQIDGPWELQGLGGAEA